MTDKCYSLDDEEFNCQSVGELIDGCNDRDLVVGDSYWEADCTSVSARDAVPHSAADSLIEDMENRLYDDIGEGVSDAFSGVTPEAKLELDAFLLAWVEKHADLHRFWKIVGKSRELKFTAEDLS